jgi:hypothetical protein
MQAFRHDRLPPPLTAEVGDETPILFAHRSHSYYTIAVEAGERSLVTTYFIVLVETVTRNNRSRFGLLPYHTRPRLIASRF